ncbi:hypothetical protein N0V82_010574 [Gnomoniopsis sp. IMI 355080]|nr:hypothetical protein N0V82_010574 [Gnomoniopsis sp. IMI 355080]
MPTTNNKVYDVLIIGGGPAGLSIATTIVRQLQTAIVLDSGVYRNSRSEYMHGVPAFDHVDPVVFRTKAKGDILSRYDTVEFRKTRVTEIKKLDSGVFQATDWQDNVFRGRKVALATGVKDIMPEIDGYDECWGRGIFHCLFCHGYEERDGDSVGLLATGLFNSAAMISHVSGMALNLAKKLTIYTNGNDAIAADIEANAKIADFQTRVTVEKRKIKSLKMVALWEASDVVVTLEDGTEINETFLVSHPDVELNGPFVAQLGLETGPQGEIKVNAPFNETSVHGVFAAGDVASQIKVVPSAIYGGSMVGGGLVAQLLAEKAQAP